ncbi:MAG: hypothetical protein ACXVBZ_14700, partial [Flavisolibacter sp.]
FVAVILLRKNTYKTSWKHCKEIFRAVHFTVQQSSEAGTGVSQFAIGIFNSSTTLFHLAIKNRCYFRLVLIIVLIVDLL